MRNLVFKKVFLMPAIAFCFLLSQKIYAQNELLGKWKINRTWVDTVLSGDASDQKVAFTFYMNVFSGDTLHAQEFTKKENNMILEMRMNFLADGKMEMLTRNPDSLESVQLLYEINAGEKIVSWKKAEGGKGNTYAYELKEGLLYLSNKKKRMELIKVR
ncbi:MAG: hypothetical protein IAF38_08895 [Bacteroidia bacterium]|nr:hypothetical protein [Bacteroidia bacterium]